ncbi:AraC family transcriptional regulator [Parahaliea mediterranea]|uniref:AraC family transcriptional regulator n=1 Tax=Parahaliea mediterranea TaxID=651086 RepID=A0A939ILV5_9GAMM|nr:AraC family transcriptional regulator [Parahaliea mediterranea]MBN7796890.1 AraC family transcriptional regulator [Parahaliea mediterranea]
MTIIDNAHIARHGRGLRPVLGVMESLGIGAGRCLEGTGIAVPAPSAGDPQITLDQEYAFYRNILRASGNPQLGLLLGGAFTPETYGILGYAMQSAASVRELLELAYEFRLLTFTHFHLAGAGAGGRFSFRFEPAYPIPDDLLQVFCDRDLSAAVDILRAVGLDRKLILEVQLMHAGKPDSAAYGHHFGCPVRFGCPHNALVFDEATLDIGLPRQDPETLENCRQQCRRVLARVRAQSSLAARVSEILLSRVGTFPTCEEVARRLHCDARTLRRNLEKEGTSFSATLGAVRLALAKEYLGSGMSVRRVAELLDYSEVAAFSRAFKRWTHQSPSAYRAGTEDQLIAKPS